MRFYTRISKEGFAFISTDIKLIDVFGLACNILWAILCQYFYSMWCQKYRVVLLSFISVSVFQRMANIAPILQVCTLFYHSVSNLKTREFFH
jgi:hypothetical protein